MPVPEYVHGWWCSKYWDFFYNGWESGEGGDAGNSARYVAMQRNFSLENIKCCLDRNLLQSLGIGAAWMKDNDSLFFYQLVIPVYSVIKSVIRNDMRKY